MLKKTITYEDFNGDEVSEDFFFHLSKAELVEMELSHEDGLSEALQRIIAAKDGKGIVTEFKNIILSAYGKRSSDGKRFVKNADVREEFESSEAYSTLFMELVTDTDAAIEFINGIVPSGLAEDAAKVTGADLEVVKSKPIIISKADIAAMSREDIVNLPARISAGEIVISDEGDSNA